jgi:hypothetical protein
LYCNGWKLTRNFFAYTHEKSGLAGEFTLYGTAAVAMEAHTKITAKNNIKLVSVIRFTLLVLKIFMARYLRP